MNLDPWQVRDKPARSTKESSRFCDLTHCDPSSLSHHEEPWVEFALSQVCWCTKSSLHWHNQVTRASRLIGCASLNIAWRWCALSCDDALLYWQYVRIKRSNVEWEGPLLVQNAFCTICTLLIFSTYFGANVWRRMFLTTLLWLLFVRFFDPMWWLYIQSHWQPCCFLQVLWPNPWFWLGQGPWRSKVGGLQPLAIPLAIPAQLWVSVAWKQYVTVYSK